MSVARKQPIVADLARRLAALEESHTRAVEEVGRLRKENGRLLAMAFFQNGRLSAVEVKLGISARESKPKPAGLLPLKAVAFDSGWSETKLRNLERSRRAAGDPIGEWAGDRVFVDPAKVPAKLR